MNIRLEAFVRMTTQSSCIIEGGQTGDVYLLKGWLADNHLIKSRCGWDGGWLKAHLTGDVMTPCTKMVLKINRKSC